MTGLEALTYESLRAYVGFDEASASALRELYPFARSHFPEIIDDFYDTIKAHPEASAVITGGEEQIERLKKSLTSWLESVLLGPHDSAHLEAHARIGRVHVRIALPQEFMFTAMNRIRSRLMQVVITSAAGDAERIARGARAVSQVLDLELAIMLDAYRETLLETVRTSERLATIGQLAASIGHELRNPLSVIESSLYIVRQRMEKAGLRDEKLDRHYERITGQVGVCLKTIENLLDLARDRSPRKRRQPLAPLVGMAVERAELQGKLNLKSNVPEQLTVDVDGDDLVLVV
ncbi:MAG TPA: protoglobin domain-containing protein, partial [Polyangiaceae bacterium]|nr:protoglobin domain-containing protein [Polyangiaceae bacterium]